MGLELLLLVDHRRASLLLSIAVVSLDLDLDRLNLVLLEGHLPLCHSSESSFLHFIGSLLLLSLLFSSLELLLDLLDGDGGVLFSFESLLDLGVLACMLGRVEVDGEGDGLRGLLLLGHGDGVHWEWELVDCLT